MSIGETLTYYHNADLILIPSDGGLENCGLAYFNASIHTLIPDKLCNPRLFGK